MYDDALALCHRADTSVGVSAPASLGPTGPALSTTCCEPSTLLELAAKEQPSQAIVSALQVLEPKGSDLTPVPISLSQSIPVPVYDLTRPSVPVRRTLQDVLGLCRPWTAALRTTLPYGLEWHVATHTALNHAIAQPSWGCRPERVCIYTDGSCDGRWSAWSFVVVGFVGEVAVSVYWAAARVADDVNHVDWVGATEQGSQQAEASAFCLAAFWILQCFQRRIDGVYSDSLTTVMRCKGAWNFPSADALAWPRPAGRLPRLWRLWGSCPVMTSIMSGRIRAVPGMSWRMVLPNGLSLIRLRG